LPIIIEGKYRPITRWGEIKFPIIAIAWDANKELKTGSFPQIKLATRYTCWWSDLDPVQIAE
jgi:hypothetical protein